jgi:hypothetical protein
MEGVVNASVGLKIGSSYGLFPQVFPQACGKTPSLKVML